MKKSGIKLITQELKKQIEKHGNPFKYDCNVNIAARRLLTIDTFIPYKWDKNVWSKMIVKSYKERLIIAGALIAMEIDRLQNS